MTKLLESFINKILYFFGYKLLLLNHNNIEIENYPENKWYLIPYPYQKGYPYNTDNLTTVNRHSFINDKKFLDAKNVGEKRWGLKSNIRDISWRLHTFLWSISYSLNNLDSKDKSEIFIECGTGKGYMSAAAANYFDWDINKPDFFLIDTFKSTIPDNLGLQNDNGEKLFVYADNDIEVRDYFSRYPSFKIVTGKIPSILSSLPSDKKIKFLHLDLNHHEAEKSALKFLQRYFIKGTLILFDDFGGPGGAEQAKVHEEFALDNNKFLLQLPTGQAIIIW